MIKKIITYTTLALCLNAFGGDYYISSSSGNDKNDGSQAKPLKTIGAAPKEGVNIFLKRGDVFYEGVRGFKESSIDAYGEGEKPLICGFKILKNPSAWENMGNDVWRLDLNKAENFSGRVNPDKSENPKQGSVAFKRWKYGHNDIGFIYDSKNRVMHGHMVRALDKLEKDWDFFVSSTFETEKLSDETFRYIYVKLPHSPSENAELCFSTHPHGIRGLYKCTIKNVAIKGFSVHGICGVRNCVIDSVDIDMIGGAVQIGHPRFARLGNGVEFWIGTDMSMNDNLVQNCTISRTYDCGTTIQGMANYDRVGAPPTNDRFINNRFYHCRQAFEHFIPHVTEFVNCEFSGNVCYEMGQNEFSSPELRDANILSYEAKNRLIKISDNVFFNANHYCGKKWSVNMSGNTVYIKKGQYLNNFFGKYSPIIFGEPNAVEEYRARLGDNSTKFIEITDANTAELMSTTFAWVKELEKKMGKTTNK